jgi:Protein of unknown function (DUF4232)
MGSTFRVIFGLSLASLVALAGCGSSHPASRAGSVSSTTAAPANTAAPATTSPAAASSTAATAPLPPPTRAGTPPITVATAAAGGCLAGQLAIHFGPALGAAGWRGYTNRFQNISSSTCTLYGYPGMQMLGSSGQPIPTDVIRGTSVTVPFVAEKQVTLGPGAEADFDMGFAASTGYGDANSPSSARVEFTAPNDFQSLTVALAIQPYGGATTSHLHCGEIHVSPVYAAS